MPKANRHLIAVLCVLLLNLQLFAANALGCVHAESTLAGQSCPHSGAVISHASTDSEGQADGDRSDEPCQKCNLDTVAAGWHLFGIHPPALAQLHAELPRAAVATRLPTYSPDGLLRPPRRIFG